MSGTAVIKGKAKFSIEAVFLKPGGPTNMMNKCGFTSYDPMIDLGILTLRLITEAIANSAPHAMNDRGASVEGSAHSRYA